MSGARSELPFVISRALALGAALAVVLSSGGAAAEPVRYRIDPSASELTFRARSVLQTADGRFHRFRGEVLVDRREPATARIHVIVDAASIDTANRRRDAHLRDEDFFWVERHPEAVFESIRVERVEPSPRGAASGFAGRVIVVGRLTLRGVTREVSVPVDVDVGGAGVVARGEIVLNRKDYGLSYRSFFNPIRDDVHIAFTFRAAESARTPLYHPDGESSATGVETGLSGPRGR